MKQMQKTQPLLLLLRGRERQQRVDYRHMRHRYHAGVDWILHTTYTSNNQKKGDRWWLEPIRGGSVPHSRHKRPTQLHRETSSANTHAAHFQREHQRARALLRLSTLVLLLVLCVPVHQQGPPPPQQQQLQQLLRRLRGSSVHDVHHSYE